MGKLFERMANERLVWWAENNSLIHSMQNGFCRGRSCIYNLAKIMTDTKTAMIRGEYVLVTFLDVTLTYDNVHPHIMMNELNKMFN